MEETVNVLVTGANGFIGKNLCARLRYLSYERVKNNLPRLNVIHFDSDEDSSRLTQICKSADLVFHLAGVNRPDNENNYMSGNAGFTAELLKTLVGCNNTPPVVFSSSVQATLNNPYGKSKYEAEQKLFEYGRETGAAVYIYRFPNVFGKWSKPLYNSAVATFCYNIARGLPVTVSDENKELTLAYIDDVVDELTAVLTGKEHRDGQYCYVPVTYKKTLGEITAIIGSFKENRKELLVHNTADGFTDKLYATYSSFLPEDDFTYAPASHTDSRGSFTEFIRTPDSGQFSVNKIKPGVVKGEHWHNRKTEKFLVVSGECVIRFRKPFNSEVIEYRVSGEEMRAVDIPAGYTHNIENTGDTEAVVFMWASECYDPQHPDTYFLKVESECQS